jgi:hypothetical protein
MKNGMTYGTLFAKLRRLGYTVQKYEYEGSSQLVFSHRNYETARIVLPDKAKTDPVDPMYLGAVRAILKSHGVIAPNGEPAIV